MSYYFSLQLKRTKRLLNEIGLNPILAFALSIIAIVICSELLFQKTEYAPYVCAFLFLYFILNLANKNRVRLTRRIYSKSQFYRIRLTENITLLVLFGVILLLKNAFIPFMLCMIIAIVSVFVDVKNPFANTVATPFRKIPHESIVGFRKTYLLIGFLYLVLVKAIQVDNYNLGIAVLFFLFLTILSAYFKPEDQYFVWIENSTVNQFLIRKMKFGIISTIVLLIPIVATLAFFFPDKIFITVASFFLGLLFLAMIILAKYSAYPNEMNLPQAILIALCFWFPPTLIIVIPYFYKKAFVNLRPILA